MYSLSLSNSSALLPSPNSFRIDTASDGLDEHENIRNEKAIVHLTSSSSIRSSELKRIEKVLCKLSATALHAIPPLTELYLEYQDFLKLRISNCGISCTHSLVTKSKNIHDFVDQLGLFENDAIRPAEVQSLAAIHRDMLRLQTRICAREVTLIQELKPTHQSLKDVLARLDKAGLERIELEVREHLEARKRAPYIPHPTRCFFLEIPRKLRERIYVSIRRLHLEAILFGLNSREHCYRYRTKLQRRADLDVSCSLLCVSSQIRAEFQEIFYTPDVVVGHVWDDRVSPACWKEMARSVLQKCFGKHHLTARYAVYFRPSLLR